MSRYSTVVDQLTLKMRLDSDISLDNFHVRPGTSELMAAVRGSQAGAFPSFFLWGNEGVGKSHFLQGVSRAAGVDAVYLPLSELLPYPPEAVLDGLLQASLVVVDDVHVAAASADWQQQLFHLFNRLKDTGIAQCYSANKAPAGMADMLPDLRSRWSALPVYQMPAFSEDELGDLLKFRAARRGLKLSDEVVSYILNRAPRSAPPLMQLLERLDQASLSRSRPITIPLLAELRLWSTDQ